MAKLSVSSVTKRLHESENTNLNFFEGLKYMTTPPPYLYNRSLTKHRTTAHVKNCPHTNYHGTFQPKGNLSDL